MTSRLTVWAPTAVKLALHLEGTVVDMVPIDGRDGWWESPSELSHGTRYYLSIDDGPRVPDPRSRRQPEGVHGPSEIVDPEVFSWSDSAWRGCDIRGAITYELHVGTFTPEGTFAAAARKLPHLATLGVDLVEVMPIAPVPGERNWGYDGVELYAVTDNYGGPAEFARFVDAAHRHGIGVCLDVVYNHLGPDGNYLSMFGPYFTDAHETPWGAAINLDGPDSGPVRQFIVDNALQWVRDYHVDALRLDAVAYLIDDSPRHILAELSDAVHSFGDRLGRTIGLIAESDLNDPRMVTPTGQGGYGMDGQWDDDIHHALHVYATGEDFAYYGDFARPGAVEKVMRHAFLHDGTYSSFRGAMWGAPVDDAVDGHAFVGATENHDQVGNRAIGDRPSAKLPAGVRAAQLGLLLASPFSPMLFMGQEWATRRPFQFFTDHHEELGRLVEEGRRAEFAGWDWLAVYHDLPEAPAVPNPQAASTFANSRLDWAELDTAEAQQFLAFVTAAIALRKETPEFSSGDRRETEIVRFGGSGYLRRGAAYAVYSLEETARVSIPTDAVTERLSWSEPAISQPRPGVTQVDFAQPGITFLVPPCGAPL